MKPIRLFILSILFITSVMPASRAAIFDAEDDVVARSRILMGTTVEIKVPQQKGLGPRVIEAAIDKAFGEIERCEALFSVYKTDSEISRINRLKKKNKALKISEETFSIIKSSKEYCEKTGGAFDITVKPLVDLWGFHEARSAKREVRIPSDDSIREALNRVGSRHIVLDELKRTIAFDVDGMEIDLGGVAKGYAADRATGVLKSCGIKNAIVNAGGDMYCLGRKSKKHLWKAGVRHPRKKDEIFFELHIENKGIVTSGDYERYFDVDGRRYSHIIDPKTGYPVEEKVVSATVIADDAETADMLATALCVTGVPALKVVESVSGADALLIVKEEKGLKTEMTKGFKAGYNVIEQDL